MHYLYGIIDDPSVSLPAAPGLGVRPPEVFDIGGLGAVAGQIGLAAPVADAASVRRHLEVLEALMERCAVLPVRFGSTYSGPEQLVAYVSESQEALAADLARVRGHVEIGVRAVGAWAPLPAPKPDNERGVGLDNGPATGPGAGYLAAKLARSEREASWRRQTEALADVVVGRLAPLASSHRWQAAPMTERPEISSAFLVRRERFELFREALAALGRAEPDLKLLCTGPWPAYSFVG